ncbi:MAG: hypothetical protein AAFQ45_04750 [Pseudomonadota bacterium]
MFEDLLYQISIMRTFEYNLIVAIAALCAYAVKELLDSWGIALFAWPALAAGGLISHVRLKMTGFTITPEPVSNTIMASIVGMTLVLIFAIIILAMLRVWRSQS